MNDLPDEILDCIIDHLDVFSAHKFALTEKRILKIIDEERKFSSKYVTRYTEWFYDVSRLANNRLNAALEQMRSKYCRYEIVHTDYFEADEFHFEYELILYDLITGKYKQAMNFTLNDLIEQTVKNEERYNYENPTRCIECGILFNFCEYSSEICTYCTRDWDVGVLTLT